MLKDKEKDELPRSSIVPAIRPITDSAAQPAPSPTSQPVTNSVLQTVAVQTQEEQVLKKEDINKINVNQLKEELSKQNKLMTGIKKELQEDDEAVPGFASAAKWVCLQTKTTEGIPLSSHSRS